MRRSLALVALFCGCIGFFVGHRQRPPPCGPEPTRRLALAHDVEPEVPLTAEDLTLAPGDVADGALSPGDEGLVVGEAFAVRHLRGDLLHVADLHDAALPIQKKARAAVIDISARTPSVRATDHIDVLGTFPDPQTNEYVAVTLTQNVIVVGVETLPERRQRLTLLVLPEEAEIILLAQKLGSVEVTQRNPEDVDVLEERGRATINTLLSGERARLLMNKRSYSAGCCVRARP